MTKRAKIGGIALVVAVMVVAAVATPTIAARAALFNQVNDALTYGGFSLTYENWLPFADGVAKGHYKTLDQLKGAAKWHKQNSTMPDRSKFGTAIAKAVGQSGATKCRTGNVLSFSAGQITISKAGGNVKISITKAQYTNAINRSIVNGNEVKVCSKNNFKTAAGNIIKLSGGNADEGGGGGGGGSSSSGGS